MKWGDIKDDCLWSIYLLAGMTAQAFSLTMDFGMTFAHVISLLKDICLSSLERKVRRSEEALGFNYLLLSHKEGVYECPLVVSVQGFEAFYENIFNKIFHFFWVLNKNFVVLQEESKDWEYVVYLQDAEMARKKKQLLSRCTTVQQCVLRKAFTEDGA